MNLIKITKLNREPKVGEWYYYNHIFNKYSKSKGHCSNSFYKTCKAISISVILDAPEIVLVELLPSITSYPISNSEEIFQWLHDNGKLGEEWVEWPYNVLMVDGGTNGISLNGALLSI